MNFLVLLPNPAGYSHKPSAALVSRVEVAGGFDVRRGELQNVSSLFSTTYNVGPEGFAYLNDFVAAHFAAPAPFHALLVGLPTNGRYPLQRFVVRIMPGTYQVAEQGRTYAVTMQLEGYLDEEPLLTSRPYPLTIIDSFDVAAPALPLGTEVTPQSPTEEFDLAAPVLLAGTLVAPISGIDYPEEEFNLTAPALLEGTLRDIIVDYFNYAAEGMDLTAPVLLVGTLKEVVVDYNNYAAEGMDLTAPAFISGTLT